VHQSRHAPGLECFGHGVYSIDQRHVEILPA
jgi:hypothetical protein